jgi:hypothetical protein
VSAICSVLMDAGRWAGRLSYRRLGQLSSGRRPRVRVERGILECRQPQVRRDSRNVCCAVTEAFELARHQFGVGQPLLPFRQFLIFPSGSF